MIKPFLSWTPQMIIQIEATLTGWGLLWTWVQTSGIWSEEERTLYINLLKLLVIKLALFSFAKGKRMKAIHFQINKKTALSYLSKMGNKERTYDQTEQRVLVLSSKSQYVYHSRIPAFSTEYSSKQGIKKKTRLFRVASSFQKFSSVFSTTRFSSNRSICFLPMPSATTIYSMESRFLQPGGGCNDTKLEHWSFTYIPPFQYDFKSAPKIKTGMFSSPFSACTSL